MFGIELGGNARVGEYATSRAGRGDERRRVVTDTAVGMLCRYIPCIIGYKLLEGREAHSRSGFVNMAYCALTS